MVLLENTIMCNKINFILYILLLFSIACSPTFNRTISIDADYAQEVTDENKLELENKYKFALGEFVDLRYSDEQLKNDSTYIGTASYKDGGLLIKFKYTYIYHSEKPVEENVVSGFRNLVEFSAQEWVENSEDSDININIELLDLTPRNYKILFSESIEGYTRFKVSFVDAKTNELIYQKEVENENDIETLFSNAFDIRIKRSLLMSILDVGRDRFLEKAINDHFNAE